MKAWYREEQGDLLWAGFQLAAANFKLFFFKFEESYVTTQSERGDRGSTTDHIGLSSYAAFRKNVQLRVRHRRILT